jgi:hypothetical protein
MTRLKEVLLGVKIRKRIVHALAVFKSFCTILKAYCVWLQRISEVSIILYDERKKSIVGGPFPNQ